MAIKRTDYTDGITTDEAVTITLRHSKGKALTDASQEELTQALNDIFPTARPGKDPGAVGTFLDATIGAAVDFWRGQPTKHGKAAPLTRAWYRDEIIRLATWIDLAQFDSNRPLTAATLEAWIVSAVQLGSLITEANWRFAQGDHIRRSQNQVARLKANNVLAVKARRNKSDKAHTQLSQHVAAYRSRHPEHSVRAIAGNLKRKYRSIYRGTAIDALAQRIRRL